MNIVFSSIIKIFFIVFFGFCCYRKKIIKEESLKFLTVFVVNFAVPALIFTSIISGAEYFPRFRVVWFLSLSVLIFLAGLFAGGIGSFFVDRNIRKEFLFLSSFQNSGYLPMNIAVFLLSPLVRDEFLIYIFLYLIGFNFLMWSIGSFFIFKRKEEKFEIKSLFNPPVLSAVASLLLVYSGMNRFLPEMIVSPLKMLGDTGFPLSMILLGAWLGRGRIRCSKTELWPLVLVNGIKLLVIPAFFFILTGKSGLSALLGLFVVLQASMPSAASLPIVADLRGANTEFISRGVFLSHVLSLVTVPLWIEAFSLYSGYRF